MGTVVLGLLIGALFGVVARRSWVAGAAGFALIGVLGIAAAASNPRVSMPLMALVIGAGVAVGLAVLRRLLGTSRHGARR